MATESDNKKWKTGIKNLNSKPGLNFNTITTTVNGLNKSLVGNEATGNTSHILNASADTIGQVGSTFNPLGGMANSIGKFAGNLIGGTKDRVQGAGSAAVNAVSTGLSFLGPVGMVAGAALNFINGIGGKRVRALTNKTDEIASGYSGSIADINDNITKYSNKKAGLFDFGFASKGNKILNEIDTMQTRALEATEKGKLAKSNAMGATYFAQNQNRFAGYSPQLLLPGGKHGMKLPELENARNLINSWVVESIKSQDPQKFQNGGKIENKNVIPEGTLHARIHNLEEVNPDLKDQITHKGIPVITQSEGGIIQVAEIEKEEWTLRKEFTDKLEDLYKKYKENSSEEIAIEAGKLICYELLKNTDDRAKLIKSVK